MYSGAMRSALLMRLNACWMSDKLSLKLTREFPMETCECQSCYDVFPQATQLNFDLPSSPFLHGSRRCAIMQGERDGHFKQLAMIEFIHTTLRYRNWHILTHLHHIEWPFRQFNSIFFSMTHEYPEKRRSKQTSILFRFTKGKTRFFWLSAGSEIIGSSRSEEVRNETIATKW